MSLKFVIRPRKGKHGTTYQVDLTLPNGKRYRPTFKTHRMAAQEARRKVNEILAGAPSASAQAMPAGPGKTLLATAVKAHIDQRKLKITDAENMQAFKYIFEYFLDSMDARGVLYVDDVTLAVLEDVQNRWATVGLDDPQRFDDETDSEFEARLRRRQKSRAPIAAPTINRRFNAIRSFFDHCVSWKYIEDSPCRGLDRLSENPVERQPWPPDAFAQIVRACEEWCRNILVFIDETGCRPKEAINLEEQDVNLAEKKVRLRTGKGGGMIRWVPVTENMALFLAHVIATKNRAFPKVRQITGQDLVFVYRNGTKIHRNRISDQVRVARRKLGLSDGIVPYGLRHGVLTTLGEMGASMRVIQQLAGHRRVQTTMGYMHPADQTVRNVVVDLAERKKERRTVG